MLKCYKNNFGKLNDDGITVMMQSKEQTIPLKHIISIKFVKRQKFHLNYTALLVSLYLFVFIRNNTLSHITEILILFTALLLLGACFYLKLFQSTFILIKKNDIIAIEVSKKQSKDAENLANQWLKKITTSTPLQNE
nr:hypothetical protein [uncultured Flavobacterium sp.]